MKWIFDLLPFLASYPTWVKALLSGWILLTAVCVVALIVGYQPVPAPAAAQEAWLRIQRVEIEDAHWDRVRVTAKINNREFEYPSVGNVQWMIIGPDMSQGLFKIP